MYHNDIVDIVELENHVMIQINYHETNVNDLYNGTDVNIAIASAITAYARIHMSQFKNKY